MYTLGIFLYVLGVKIAALFNQKARLMVNGHKDTWRILKKRTNGHSFVWFHAASLGEFEQGRPLMERLKKEHPEKRILLTFFSPSGYEVRKDYPFADIVCYLPIDTPLNARRFIRIARPEMAFFIKYEFWRNYIDTLHHHHIPVYSVSSIFRPNQIFFRWYGRGYGHCLRRISYFFVQNEDSKKLLNDYGIKKVMVVGDTRFARVRDIKQEAKDLPLVEEFVAHNPHSPILIAGSTWPADEEIIINYFNSHPNLRLILAPHVVNEEHIQKIQTQLQRKSIRYSESDPKSDCLIIDCYRLLSSIYRYATIAYIGGGFGVGIHNVPEAAVYGIPVIIGPNNKKFKEAQDLLKNGGCIEIQNEQDFETIMDQLQSDPLLLEQKSKAAHDYIKNNAKAADIIYNATLGTNPERVIEQYENRHQ